MNWRLFLRKVLGPRGVALARSVIAPIYKYMFKVDPPSKYRPYGVSAIVCSKNEEDWIALSMRSVAEIVNEYVVIDSSTDRTPEIAVEVGRELGIPVRVFKIKSTDMAVIRNIGLKNSTYRWILIWDPDFILHEKYVKYLKELIEKLDRDKWYYAIYWPHICLDGDLFHYNPRNYLHREHWLFVYHPSLRYKTIDWLERLILPLFYKRIDIDNPLSFHLRTVKNPVRLLYRKYWYEVLRKKLIGKIDLDTYVHKRIIEEYGTDDIKEAANTYLKNLLSTLEKYDPQKHLPYPKILREYIRKKYGLIL